MKKKSSLEEIAKKHSINLSFDRQGDGGHCKISERAIYISPNQDEEWKEISFFS